MTCEEIENRVIAIAGEHTKLALEHLEIFGKPGSEKRCVEIHERIEQLRQERVELIGR
ncbi:hypothetical protein [Peptoclostridium litorale]|uniref:hypothetical protein n=1 Tax=Peptoclostridium litorale TaxID=1557 RepID=UPI001378CAF5|nr:hypothetical protein [Peptoclostridium litorale]